jgi:hypothetical protein
MALFAYDRASGQLVWSSGTMLATANAKDVYIGPVGPIQSGTIRGGPEYIGIKLPLSADSPSAHEERPAVPFTTPAIRTPASTSDLESFKP